MSSSGKWYLAQKTLALQASKAMFTVQNQLAKLGDIPVNAALKVFDGKISQILNYAAEIWGFHKETDIERVHSKFLRYILGLNRHTPNCASLPETGRLQLIVTRQIKIIKYWFKLLNLKPDCILSLCYKYQYGTAENDVNCWALDVKHLLCCFGFSEVWQTQGVGNENSFINIFKDRCKDINSQLIHSEMLETSKLDMYCNFKSLLTYHMRFT